MISFSFVPISTCDRMAQQFVYRTVELKLFLVLGRILRHGDISSSLCK